MNYCIHWAGQSESPPHLQERNLWLTPVLLTGRKTLLQPNGKTAPHTCITEAGKASLIFLQKNSLCITVHKVSRSSARKS